MKPSFLVPSVLLVCACTSHLATSATLHVWQDSPSPGPPYATWTTAAHVIQDAVDAAVDGDTVLVTNGVYATGGRAVHGTMTNRVAIDRAITLRSVSGLEMTTIKGGEAPGGDTYGNGDGAIRCVYLGNGASLEGFTLANGHTRRNGNEYQEMQGGGVWSESSGVVTKCALTGNSAATSGGGALGSTLYNCLLTGNFSQSRGGGAHWSTLYNCTLTNNEAGYEAGGAYGGTLYNCILVDNAAPEGGGASWGTLYDCTLSGNVASWYGGGASWARLYNCILTGNSTRHGGGAYQSTLYNCTVLGNSAATSGAGIWGGALYNSIVYHNEGGNYSGYCTFQYSCTTPLPEGEGNFDAEPLIMQPVAGDLRLAPGSPCIDAGSDFYLAEVRLHLSDILTTDLDGNPRLLDGDGDGIPQFDVGAYEYRPPNPAEDVETLIAQVIGSDLAHNCTNPLLATLRAAAASFERESSRSGVNQLRAFQKKVQAQVAPADPDLAAQLVAAAQEVIDTVQAAAVLRIKAAGPKAALLWQQGVLQEAETLEGPWEDVSEAASPHEVEADSRQKFYRVKME